MIFEKNICISEFYIIFEHKVAETCSAILKHVVETCYNIFNNNDNVFDTPPSLLSFVLFRFHVFFNSWDSAFKVLKWLLYGLLTQGSNIDFLKVKRNLLRLFRGTLNLIKNDIQNQRVPQRNLYLGIFFYKYGYSKDERVERAAMDIT